MNWLFTRQIRSRLTIWYSLVLAMILVVYIALVFFFQYEVVRRQMYHDEVQDVETVEGLLYFDNQGALKLQQNYFSHPQSHLLIDRFMEVRDLSGVVLYRTPNLKEMQLGGPSYANEGDESFDPRITKLDDGSHVYLISHIHIMQGKTLLIRLAYSLAPFRERMIQFLELLLVALPATLLLAGFAGYHIAKRALKPLENMALKAEQINAQNLNDRLDTGNPDDELGRMAKAFNELLVRLEEAFQQLNSFTADAAHELRAPMAAIRAIGEVALKQDVDREGMKDSIAGMLEEASRLEERISGLLLLAKAEAAQAQGPNTFSLIEVVSEIVVLLEVLAEERGIQLTFKVFDGDKSAVSGDRALIRSAVMNVVHNAIKFSPSNATVSITHTLTSDEKSIELGTTDQGLGIRPGELDAVFDRFYTSTQQTTPNHGSGLGLSIAQLVIQRSGGEIFFDPKIISGARCVIRLPLWTPGERT